MDIFDLMSDTICISEFSSLWSFSKWQHGFEKEECYIQKFGEDDAIVLQFSYPNDADLSFYLLDGIGERTPISPSQLGVDDDSIEAQLVVKDLDFGSYRLDIENDFDDVVYSCQFEICTDEDLCDMVHLRYTHYRDQFNSRFNDTTFDFRVEGGFLFDEFDFNSDTENFRDQSYNNNLLSAFPYTKQVLTIGSSIGVPIWVGKLINHIFSLSSVLVDGVAYARGDGASVELEKLSSLYPRYVFKIEVERRNTYSNRVGIYDKVYDLLATEDSQILGTEEEQGIIV